MKIDLSGQVAVVTGASRGIGAEIARRLADCGAHVIVNYHRNEESARAVMEQIAASGGSGEILRFDVADEAAVAEAFGAIAERHGRIDVLINNAGVSKDGLLLRTRVSDFDRLVDTNLKGTFLCAFNASRYMLKQRRGRIVNLSSIVGLGGNAGQSVYAATKAGIIGFTKSLAKELGPRGINVNAVAPGLVATEMTKDIDRDALCGMVPLGRIGQPGDVAGVVLFLCSGLADYVTGQVIVVDGGIYA